MDDVVEFNSPQTFEPFCIRTFDLADQNLTNERSKDQQSEHHWAKSKALFEHRHYHFCLRVLTSMMRTAIRLVNVRIANLFATLQAHAEPDVDDHLVRVFAVHLLRNCLDDWGAEERWMHADNVAHYDLHTRALVRQGNRDMLVREKAVREKLPS